METTISATPAPEAPPPAPSPAPAAATAPDPRIAALEAELQETRRANEFWASRAQALAGPAPAVAAPAPEPEPEPEDNTDILDLLATQGAKGFDAYMQKRGYVTIKKAEEMVRGHVDAKGNQLSTEAELLANYPDLRDKSSEFFRQTAINYGELTRQGVAEPLAMKLAAQQTELQGFRSGKVKTPAEKTEAARVARIKAQSGDRAANRTADSGEEDDSLTDQEKHICVAMGITEEAYIARAKKGVRMGGLGRR